MSKIVVFFPGAGYGIDSPLLYYADFLYEINGYERKYIDYQSIVMNIELSIDEKKKQVREFVANKANEILFNEYDEIVFVSKSIGTVEAGWIAEKLHLKVIQIFLTPTVEAIPYFSFNSSVVIGTCDKAYQEVKRYCDDNNINTLYIEGGNHSLEIEGKPFESINILERVIKYIERQMEN